MKKHIFILFALIASLFNISTSTAQDSNHQRSYLNGKELFALGKYGLAMQAFKPLTNPYNENPYMAYASYYYAVAAYRNNEPNEARSMLLSLKKNFPEWPQMDNANLWLTKVDLQLGHYEDAVRHYMQIKTDSLHQRAEKILAAELTEVEPYDSLYGLYKQFPNNKGIAKALADKISTLPLKDQDRGLLNNLVSLFDLDPEQYNIAEELPSEMKDSYQVAILLPFMYNEVRKNRNNIINQFVIDLYQGMLQAQQKLKSNGINIKLLCYDTEKDSSKTAEILQYPEMRHMDLIVGPLYPDPVKVVSRFSFQHQINMINPLSTNAEVIGNNPYCYLFFPSNETMGAKTSKWVSDNTDLKEGIIFHGTSSKDSVLAYTFKHHFEAQPNHKIVLIKEIDADKTKEIINILTRKIMVEIEEVDVDDPEKVENGKVELFKIRQDSLDFVFVASDNPGMAASTITALETRRDTLTIIGKGEWIHSQVVSYESLERLNAILIAPSFIDKDSPAYEAFNDHFVERFNKLPSENACIGYELVMTVGKLLNQYGTHFQAKMPEDTFKKGYLFAGFRLDNKNDNQYFPLIEFQNLELKNVNKKN